MSNNHLHVLQAVFIVVLVSACLFVILIRNSHYFKLCRPSSISYVFPPSFISPPVLSHIITNVTHKTLLTSLITEQSSPPLTTFMKPQLSQTEKSKVKKFIEAVDFYKMTDQEKKTYVRTLDEFAKLCYANNITFFIYGGSLIGTYRHHGFIPWDEDVDVIMSYGDRSKFGKLFDDGRLPIALSTAQGVKWKVFLKSGTTRTAMDWPWPFVDVFFWDETETEYYDRTDRSYRYRKVDVFPLVLRPFENIYMPVPRNGYEYVKFAWSMCCTGSWNHKKEYWSGGKKECVPCNHVRDIFPFVYRVPYNSTHNREELKQGSTIIQTKFELV